MFEIEIKVDNESDLYNPFDGNYRTLSDDLMNFISNRMTDRPLKEKIRLVFTGSEIDKNKLREAINTAQEARMRLLRLERKTAWFKCIRLLLIGIMFVVIGILFANKMGEVVGAIISTIGSFSIWEAASIWIEELPSLRVKKRLFEVLGDYEVTTKQD